MFVVVVVVCYKKIRNFICIKFPWLNIISSPFSFNFFYFNFLATPFRSFFYFIKSTTF